MLARCHSRTHKSHTTQKSSLFVALTRCTCMPPLGQVVHTRVSKCSARSSTQNPPENPRGARAPARARSVCVCGCVCVGLSLATLTRGRIGVRVHSIRGRFEQTQKRGTVYGVCIQTRNGVHPMARVRASQGVSRAHTEPALPSLPEWLSVSLAMVARL